MFGQMASQNTEHTYRQVVRPCMYMKHLEGLEHLEILRGQGKSGTSTLVVAYF